MSQPLHRRVVPETFGQLLSEYPEARGRQPEAVLDESWPQPDSQGLGGVDVALWARMLARAEAELADPRLGQQISLRHLGILGPVVWSCAILAAALYKLERHQWLIVDVTEMTQRAGPGWIERVWTSRPELHPGRLVNETGRGLVRLPGARRPPRGGDPARHGAAGQAAEAPGPAADAGAGAAAAAGRGRRDRAADHRPQLVRRRTGHRDDQRGAGLFPAYAAASPAAGRHPLSRRAELGPARAGRCLSARSAPADRRYRAAARRFRAQRLHPCLSRLERPHAAAAHCAGFRRMPRSP